MDYCFTTRCRAWTIALLRGVERGLLLYYEVLPQGPTFWHNIGYGKED